MKAEHSKMLGEDENSSGALLVMAEESSPSERDRKLTRNQSLKSMDMVMNFFSSPNFAKQRLTPGLEHVLELPLAARRPTGTNFVAETADQQMSPP